MQVHFVSFGLLHLLHTDGCLDTQTRSSLNQESMLEIAYSNCDLTAAQFFWRYGNDSFGVSLS